MTFPVLVKVNNGHFTASLIGVPNLSVEEPTRDLAIASLKVEIQQRIELGELLQLEVDTIGVSQLAGKYKDDLTLREISDQAYQLRDAER
ncbi:MAG: hypothetical protein M3X11_05605 [Acidobacteriota bacterium]|nr:hypothetical protein [Acidobacteriota bacterium]